jgi:sucrose-6-phosphate hydrolase SacC (GH32 family)
MFTYNGPNMRYGNLASQALAYSLDGGETLIKYDGNPTIPHIVGGNRDPKIFWHEPTKRWVTPLYMDGEDYAIFTSPDLKTWTKTCDVKNLGCSECPDLFALPVDGDASKTLWVFWGGNGKYVLGDFDGETFTPQTAPLDAKWGGNDYAAQTYSDVPGRRIQFSWMQGGSYPEAPFNQQFTVPRELTLRSTPDGVRLCINPVEELKTLRGARLSLELKTRKDGSAAFVPVPKLGDSASFDLLDVELSFEIENVASQTLAIRGRKIELNFAEKTMKHEGVVAPLAVEDGKVSLRLVLDRTSLEIFANDGLSQIAKCFVPEDKNDAPIVELSPAVVPNGAANVRRNVKLEVYPLRSVWNVEK